MYEVELKVRANHGRVERRLAELDGKHFGRVTQEDTYYDAPDRNFAETDEALRIRRESAPDDEAVCLTYKGPLLDDESKTREEAEPRVEDGEKLRAILDGLGYEPAATVRKDRDRYAVGACTVLLDRVEGLGKFVEVELETDGDIEPAREEAIAVLERLGLDPDEGIQTSYLGLLLEAEGN